MQQQLTQDNLKSIANKSFGAHAQQVEYQTAKTPMFKGRNKGLEKATVVGVAATPAIVGGGIYLANRWKKRFFSPS
jgi:hypothetical protein